MGTTYKRFCFPVCMNCTHHFWYGEMIFHSKHGYRNFICQKCSERENMPNIKITAEIGGKQVSLNNISTETFEAIKALEKPKEIPAIAIGNYKGELHNRRLFIKINKSIKDPIVKHNATMIVIDPENGQTVN